MADAFTTKTLPLHYKINSLIHSKTLNGLIRRIYEHNLNVTTQNKTNIYS